VPRASPTPTDTRPSLPPPLPSAPAPSLLLSAPSCSESAVIWSGHAKHIPPPPSTVFLLEGVQQPESRVVGAFLRVAELGLSGGGQERKIVAWNAATGEWCGRWSRDCD
jgi:hypothetical protein